MISICIESIILMLDHYIKRQNYSYKKLSDSFVLLYMQVPYQIIPYYHCIIDVIYAKEERKS